MNPSTFEHLAKKFSECGAKYSDEKIDTNYIENVMGDAGKALFDRIASGKIRFDMTPMWLKREPTTIRTFTDPCGEPADVEVFGWSLYWVFAADYMHRTKSKCENKLPETAFWIDAERCLGGYYVTEYLGLVRHVKSHSKLWSQTWIRLIKVSEKVCLYLAQICEESQETKHHEKIEIDLTLFNDGRSKSLLKDLIITPEGVKGTSQDAKNLREVLKDKNRDEYKRATNHIHKKKNEDIIHIDTNKIVLQAKNNPA